MRQPVLMQLTAAPRPDLIVGWAGASASAGYRGMAPFPVCEAV